MGERGRLRLHTGGTPAADAGPDELLVRVAGGDEAAFGSLYDVLAGPVLGIVMRVVRNRAQAEEVTQEVLVEVWQKALRFTPQRGGAMSWVMVIAHRRAVDRVRSEQAGSDREDRVNRMDVRRPFDEVAESTLASIERQRVQQCLSALTPLQRESIVLAYYNGYTYPEVAKVLNAAPGTVKTRIRDGLIRLRDCLGMER